MVKAQNKGKCPFI